MSVSLGQLLPTFRNERCAFVFKSYGVQEEFQHPLILAYEGDMLFRNVVEFKPSDRASHSRRHEYILLIPGNRRRDGNVVKEQLV